MNRDIFLVGKKMANAGLLISYGVLMATLVFAGTVLLNHWSYRPAMVLADSPDASAALQPRMVDEVVIAQNEEDHEVDGVMDYTRENKGKSYHLAARGGSFSYMMKVLPGQPLTLACRFSGDEPKGHVFDVAVDDQIIATQNLTAIAPGHYVDMEYKIPVSLTRGKSQVKVEFQAHAGMTAGGLYGCEILTR